MKPLLEKYFGFRSFRSGQEEAVQYLLQGCDTLVIMPTGAGKSLIYQYAAVVLRDRDPSAVTLVISPLVALMKDQVDSLHKHRVAATFINSTITAREQQRRTADLRDYALVYVSPERLHKSSFIAALKNVNVQLLVVDEAHCISSWGHDFRPDYRRIINARKILGKPLTVALTATATRLVQDDIVGLLGISPARRVVTGFNRPNLSFEVCHAVGTHAKRQELSFLLRSENLPGIIYTATRKETEQLAAFIVRSLSLNCAGYHAGLGAAQRERIQNAFCNGSLPLVVATNAFGMGIDRQDVRLVAHYNLPGTLEAYYQEAGRAGRDGRPARAVLLYAPQDRLLQEFFIRQSSIDRLDLSRLFKHLEGLNGSMSSNLRMKNWGRQKQQLGLSILEQAGILERLPQAGKFRLGSWDEDIIAASTGQVEEYARHRRRQLQQMNDYAQKEACRRKILLAYFSSGPVDSRAARCCDYCFRQQKKNAGVSNSLYLLSRSERAALIILDSVRQLGQMKIAAVAQLLAGKITGQFCAHRYYGRLRELGQKPVRAAIMELLRQGYLRQVENSLIDLSRQGYKALEVREAIFLQAFSQVAQQKL